MTEEELEEKLNAVCIELCGANCLLDEAGYIAIDHGYGIEYSREQLETLTVDELVRLAGEGI